MVERVPANMLWLVAGFTVWGVAFIVIYTIQSVGCAYGWSFAFHRGMLVGALALHLGVIGVMIVKAPRGKERAFLSQVTIWTLWASLVATALTYGPALVLKACI